MTTGSVPLRRVSARIASGETYPILVGHRVLDQLPGLLEELAPAFRYALIGDERVLELHGDEVARRLEAAGLRVDLFDFPAGEEHKTRECWAHLTDRLLAEGLGRDSCVLALGGGVSGDLAGFVAATFMRGLPVVQLPTSLVAMVDSSVGGKTGVDLPAGKNLVGAFHPPRLVLADVELATTLPRRERSQGLAEAVKHGAILDAGYMTRIMGTARGLLEGRVEATAEMVVRSVEIKSEVVSRDEREAGMREILNFGHTLGHALEASSGYELSHGSAVAVGMVLEARLGEALGLTLPGTTGRIQAALEAVDLPVRIPPGLDLDRVRDHLARDKKARQGRPRFVLLAEAGRVARPANEEGRWSHAVPPEQVDEVLRTAAAPPI